MLRSMFSGVSGLRAHTTMLDVVANNIANVNTSGFKASRATFQEAISQTLRGSTGSNVVRAGVNPVQLGLGANVAAIDGIFSQGATQLTGRNTDIAIQGEGFFVVSAGGEQRYTRAGTFSLDASGNFTSPTGAIVQGWVADTVGNVDFTQPVEALRLPAGQTIPPVITSLVSIGGNLPTTNVAGVSSSTSITVYDSLGEAQRLTVEFTSTAVDNQWEVAVSFTDPLGVQVYLDSTDTTPYGLQFTDTGQIDDFAATIAGLTIDNDAATGSTSLAVAPIDFGNGSDPTQSISIDLAGDVATVQFGGDNTIEARSQDGQGIGLLRGFAIGQDGSITGQFSNGAAKVLGVIALARFNNPGGLIREGESTFSISGNSGVALIGQPGDGGTGLLASGALEMSNVDLAQEFTHLIIAQRGFQANSRSITTSDEVLNELVNIKR